MRLDTLQLDLGVIGPAAGGEFVQNNFHRLIGVSPANGWANQLHNEPTIGLTFERRWRTGRAVLIENPKLEVDFIPRVGAGARQRRDLRQRRRHGAHRQEPARRLRPDARPAGAAGIGGLHRRRQLRLVSVRRRRRPGGRPQHLPRRQHRRLQPACLAPALRRRGPGGPRHSLCAACASPTRRSCARRSSSSAIASRSSARSTSPFGTDAKIKGRPKAPLCLRMSRYIRPISSRITTMMSTRPMPPLG